MVTIRVTKIKNMKDGSAKIDFEYGSDFKKAVKGYYNLRKVTKSAINAFIKEALVNYLANEFSKPCLLCNKRISTDNGDYCYVCNDINKTIKAVRKENRRKK